MPSSQNSPLVTVIVPVYNMEDYILECLESIQRSTYENIEVIVVDDGSKDGSAAIIREFILRDDRFHLISQENAGVCRARNRAIEAAHGKYILPVDADDVLCEDFIQYAVQAMSGNEDIKVVTPTVELFGERSGIWSLPDFRLSLLARKNILGVSGMYLREDAIKVGGYLEELTAREDWVFWIGMLKDGGKVLRLPKVGLRYRIRSSSKRIQDRRFKKKVIDLLNARYPDFFRSQLGGPLRYHRTWSRLINLFLKDRPSSFL